MTIRRLTEDLDDLSLALGECSDECDCSGEEGPGEPEEHEGCDCDGDCQDDGEPQEDIEDPADVKFQAKVKEVLGPALVGALADHLAGEFAGRAQDLTVPHVQGYAGQLETLVGELFHDRRWLADITRATLKLARERAEA